MAKPKTTEKFEKPSHWLHVERLISDVSAAVAVTGYRRRKLPYFLFSPVRKFGFGFTLLRSFNGVHLPCRLC